MNVFLEFPLINLNGICAQDCVKREVAEEVGLEIDTVQYDCSQHWPFPAGSLMIGKNLTLTSKVT